MIDILIVALCFVILCRMRSNARRLRDELEFLFDELEEIKDLLTAVEEADAVEFYSVNDDGTITKVEDIMFKKVDAPFRLKVAFKDKKGNPAKVDGAPAWSVTDTALAEVTADADGMAATVSPLGPIGTFKVQCNADADLGAGVKTILGEAEVELLPGDAELVEISEE